MIWRIYLQIMNSNKINSYLIFIHIDQLFNHFGDSRFWKSKSTSNTSIFVRFQVLMVASMKLRIIWDVLPYF
jgi:hypothetical protein